MKAPEPMMGLFTLETREQTLLLDEAICDWLSAGIEGEVPVWIYPGRERIILGRWDILPTCAREVPFLCECTQAMMGAEVVDPEPDVVTGLWEKCCGEPLVDPELESEFLPKMKAACREQMGCSIEKVPLMIRWLSDKGELALPEPVFSALGSGELLACGAFSRCEIMSRSVYENRSSHSESLMNAARALSALELSECPDDEDLNE